MTLRDCSIYVCVTTEGEMELFVSDLDRKAANKAQYWQETEAALVRGGHYGDGGRLPHRATTPCHALIAHVGTKTESAQHVTR